MEVKEQQPNYILGGLKCACGVFPVCVSPPALLKAPDDRDIVEAGKIAPLGKSMLCTEGRGEEGEGIV